MRHANACGHPQGFRSVASPCCTHSVVAPTCCLLAARLNPFNLLQHNGMETLVTLVLMFTGCEQIRTGDLADFSVTWCREEPSKLRVSKQNMPRKKKRTKNNNETIMTQTEQISYVNCSLNIESRWHMSRNV